MRTKIVFKDDTIASAECERITMRAENGRLKRISLSTGERKSTYYMDTIRRIQIEETKETEQKENVFVSILEELRRIERKMDAQPAMLQYKDGPEMAARLAMVLTAGDGRENPFSCVKFEDGKVIVNKEDLKFAIGIANPDVSMAWRELEMVSNYDFDRV